MGMGIAMRKPGFMEKISLPGRDAWRVQLDPTDWPELTQPLDVMNLHFAAPHTFRPRPGLWLRPRQIRAFESYLVSRPSSRCVLVGDFNATPAWPLYKRIASQFTDAAVAVACESKGRVLATWGPWSLSPRLARIDHGFVGGVAASSFQVVPVRGADHSAIVIDLASV
jgi:endonuclease/exonuclease/phosphatase family metal-dependent hydrolase